MRCEQAREQLSARLDGQDTGAGRIGQAQVDAHVAECAACARWWDQAQAVTRMARTAAALPPPALSPQALDNVLAAAPTRPEPAVRPHRAVRVLRLALLTVGLAQFFLGVGQISNFAGIADSHTHADGVPVPSGHLWHESAAWNVAIGAAIAWLAWRRSRPAGLLPVMTAFIAVLGLLTANDAMAGRVPADRVLSHSLLLAGYALLLALHHPKLRDQPPAAAGIVRRGPWTLDGGADDDDGPSAAVYPFPVRAKVVGKKAA